MKSLLERKVEQWKKKSERPKRRPQEAGARRHRTPRGSERQAGEGGKPIPPPGPMNVKGQHKHGR